MGRRPQSGAYDFKVTASLDCGEDTYPIESEPKSYTLTILP